MHWGMNHSLFHGAASLKICRTTWEKRSFSVSTFFAVFLNAACPGFRCRCHCISIFLFMKRKFWRSFVALKLLTFISSTSHVLHRDSQHMAYRNKVFCTLNTKPPKFLFSCFSCARPVKYRWCSPLQQKCLTEVWERKWKSRSKNGNENNKFGLMLIKNFFILLLEEVPLKNKILFSCKSKTCP